MPKKRDMSGFFKQVEKAADGNQKREKKDYTIEKLFNLTYKDGKAEAVIRFLPPNLNEFKPFIENVLHIKKGFGCDCWEKFGKKCPICEHNHALWKRYPKKGETTKDEAQRRNSMLLVQKKSSFLTNILVVRNENAPDTEGKVYRFRFGPQIMAKINDAMKGHEDAEDGWIEGFNPYLWDDGANFTLTAIEGEYGPDYEKSKFGKQKPINRFDRATKTFVPLDTTEQDAIEEQLLTLDQFEKKEEEYRSFDEIKEYTEKKVGFKLWSLSSDGKPIEPTADENPYSSKGKIDEGTVETEADVGDASDDFASEFDEETSTTDTEDVSVSNDDQSYFDDIENM